MRNMMKSFLLPILAAASIVLGGCSNSALNEAQESSLKGVYDAKYYLQLRPVGDLDAYKFEICLVDNLDSHCVGALKTNAGDDLLLTIKTLSELSLAESEKIALLKNHEEYLVYQESLRRRGSDAALAAGIASSIVIGGGAVTIASKEVADDMAKRTAELAVELQEAKAEYIRKVGDKAAENMKPHLLDIQNLLEQVKSDQNAMKALGEQSVAEARKLKGLQDALLAGPDADGIIVRYASELQVLQDELTGFKFSQTDIVDNVGSLWVVENELGKGKLILMEDLAKGRLTKIDNGGSLWVVENELGKGKLIQMEDLAKAHPTHVQITEKLKAAGLGIDGAPKALITAGELGNRTTLLSSKFLKFVAEGIGTVYTEEWHQGLAKALGLQPEKFSLRLYDRWMSHGGGKITEIFESEFFLTKIFEYNKIENALSDTAEAAGDAVRLAPENIDELAHAFEAGDFSFFKNAQEFVDTLGRSPKAMTLYRALKDVDKTRLLQYEAIMKILIKKSQNKLVSFDDQIKTITKSIDDSLGKIVGNIGVVKGKIGAIGDKNFQKIAELIERTDRLVKHTTRGKKFIPPTLMLATAAAVFGVGYVFAKDHVTAHTEVQDVLGQYDELSTLIRYGSPLLSVDDNYNESVSSVETVLLNFAKWQALVSSYSSDSSIVVEQICLPKVSSMEAGVLKAECQTL